VINFGFDSLQLKAIEGFVDPNNRNSIALLEKNHFCKKGQHKRISDNGEVSISQIYELTNRNL
jgi:[ribosomal protein S5]-alanine N-acetyltransferase